jgi:hypothetical protein
MRQSIRTDDIEFEFPLRETDSVRAVALLGQILIYICNAIANLSVGNIIADMFGIKEQIIYIAN